MILFPHQIPEDAISRAPGTARADFVVPEDHPFFEGHFPGNPILPGVIQLGWFLQLAGAADGPWQVRNLKFRAEIRGGDAVRVQVEAGGNAKIWRGETLCSEAVLERAQIG